MKLWIVIFHSADKISNDNVSIQFFLDFPHKCLSGTLPCFNLPAGKLPAVFEFPIAALRCKDLVIFANHSSRHMDLL